MAYTAKTNWTAADGVSAADLNKIEQGIKDALPKDGSEAYTGSQLYAQRAVIAGGSNWNSYTTLGVYRFGGTGADTNGPGFDWGTLEVMYDGTSYVIQRAIQQTAVGSNIKYRTRTELGVWSAWMNIWNSGNDGAGSGLDADTVRGYVPANKAGDAFTGNVRVQNADPAFELYEDGEATHPLTKLISSEGYIYLSAYNSGGGWLRDLLKIDKSNGAMLYQGTTLPSIRDNGGVLEFFSAGTWKAAGGVKSVQRGTFVGTGADADITISSVNMAKTWVHHTGGAGNNNLIFLLNSTTLRIAFSTGISANWEVIESY